MTEERFSISGIVDSEGEYAQAPEEKNYEDQIRFPKFDLSRLSRPKRPWTRWKGVFTHEDLARIAESKGGTCDSTNFSSIFDSVNWFCGAGHRWRAKVITVLFHGQWCHRCSKAEREEKNRVLLEEAVHKRDGNILYLGVLSNQYGRHRFRCKDGHEFTTTLKAVVKTGTWCRRCGRKSIMKTIEDMWVRAAARGGLCLSTEYRGHMVHLEWECESGHRFLSRPRSVQNGYWCQACGGTKKLTIEEMHSIAESRGGKCLSLAYVNIAADLLWRCKRGHIWNASGGEVKYGNWCARCSGVKKKTIEEMKAFAVANGGQCLSDSYIGNKALLKWRCAKGHEWDECYNHTSLRKGGWCRKCSGIWK